MGSRRRLGVLVDCGDLHRRNHVGRVTDSDLDSTGVWRLVNPDLDGRLGLVVVNDCVLDTCSSA